jgi:hypothetical protein
MTSTALRSSSQGLISDRITAKELNELRIMIIAHMVVSALIHRPCGIPKPLNC